MKTVLNLIGRILDNINNRLLLPALFIMILPAVVGAQQYVYISQVTPGSSAVVKVDTSTNTVAATLPLDDVPGKLAVTPDGGHLYVTSRLLTEVYCINAGTFTLDSVALLGGWPSGLSITPDGRYVYAFGPTGIWVLRTADNTIVGMLPTSYTAVAMAFSLDGSLAYISDGGATLHVLRTADNTFLTPFTVTGASLSTLVVSPAGPSLYAIDGLLSKIWVINYETGAVTRTITVPIYPVSIAVAPDGSNIYVTEFEVEHSDATVLLGISTGGTIRQVMLGVEPDNVSLSYPDGRFAYVANDGYAKVAVMDTATFADLTPLPPTAAAWVATQPSPYVPLFHYLPVLFFQISHDEAVLSGKFGLGTGSGGLGLPGSDLTLEIADFALTIPAKSFQTDQSGGFTFSGVVSDVNLQAVIGPVKGGYNFNFQLGNVPLKGLVSPVTVRMIVGNNIGGATIKAQITQ